MIIAGLMGSVAAAGGTPSVAWSGITYQPVYEGQLNSVYLDFTNWDDSLIYWYVVNSSDSQIISGQFTGPNSGQMSPGTGNNTAYPSFSFTFAPDATTDGPLTYYIRVEDVGGQLLFPRQGPFTCVDSSQAPTLVLDVDPASLSSPLFGLNGWNDSSGQGNNLSISGGSKSSDNGGVLVFDGVNTYAGDVMNANLNSSTYGSITLSAWIKPTVVGSGINQTIIAKELCYKLRIDTSGEIQMYTGPGYYDQTWTALTTSAGLVTAGAWAHVVATVNTNYTRIYVNGIKVAETTGKIIGANTNPFDIGCYNNTNDFFAGSMGEIKVWNYAITETAVFSQYNTTAARYGRTPLPLSLDFVGSGSTYLLAQNTQSDWNLGSTFTIEFWSKSAIASTGTILTVASQGPGDSIDVGFDNGHHVYKNTEPQYAEPTPGVWTHVVYTGSGDGYCRLYYNGMYQTNWLSGQLSDGSHDLYIGKRGPSYNQFFNGKLAMLRISNTSKYLTDFTPTTTYGVESDTKLFLGKTDPFTDLALYELNGLTTSATNGTWLYFSKATYPYLNTQIHSGDTVVNAANPTSTSTLTGEVFTPNGDPNNWGVAVANGFAADTVNFSGPRRHPIENNNVLASADFPSFQNRSLVFNQPEGDYLSTPASANWNLGTTWTIEFWLKANSSGYSGNPRMSGDIWGVLNQTGWGATNSINIAIADAKLVVGQGPQYSDVRYTEPAPAVWTHVAISNDAGTQKVFYNGVEQTKVSGTFNTANYANSSDSLAIGTTSGGNNKFDGKMALVRISNTAKYLTAFTATTTYSVEADTKLFLNNWSPTVDAKNHAVTNNGVTTSSDFPQRLEGIHNAFDGGTAGYAYTLAANQNYALVSQIPVGATIFSNLWLGARTVLTSRYMAGPNAWEIHYDATGLGFTSTSDTYTFVW